MLEVTVYICECALERFPLFMGKHKARFSTPYRFDLTPQFETLLTGFTPFSLTNAEAHSNSDNWNTADSWAVGVLIFLFSYC